jgi:hypothetical protein
MIWNYGNTFPSSDALELITPFRNIDVVVIIISTMN